ncbi:MAG: bifunctional pyr operon transcriptional regulator/uracil phosphoribosyltransferase PyrR [Deltaproteobacteria bacterium]|jgi:pyrimidine operon attenuation protein/uracil phosphoribosyltransferase|nr:bifunctional pyr operon transcriptional regulator/uracil phosphoribosyltransferase PyrR [Deltaproteobacteria bacterium]
MKLRPSPLESNLVERSEILDSVGMARVLRRLAFEVVERNGQDSYFVGIRTGGAWLAERMVRLLVEGGEKRPDLGAIDITLYRDDVFHGLPKPEIGPTELDAPIDGRTVVLVDDVLNTGRTVRAAMDVLLDYGRPRLVQLAVLIDRGRRELPIQPDFVGVRLQTTAEHSVRVMFSERGESDRVVLRERIAS